MMAALYRNHNLSSVSPGYITTHAAHLLAQKPLPNKSIKAQDKNNMKIDPRFHCAAKFHIPCINFH